MLNKMVVKKGEDFSTAYQATPFLQHSETSAQKALTLELRDGEELFVPL